jgi:hypothetical protein
MLKIFDKAFDVANATAMQSKQCRNLFYGEVIVPDAPSGGQAVIDINVDNGIGACGLQYSGHFSSLALADTGTDIIDDGICHVRGKLFDKSTDKPLFNDFIPLNLLFSPGRILVPAIGAAPVVNYLIPFVGALITYPAAQPSQGLFEPREFTYLWRPGSSIYMELKNDSTAPNLVSIAVDIIRVYTKPLPA